MSRVLQFTMTLGVDVVSFGGQSILIASTLAPRGIVERPRDTLEHKKGGISVDFGWISGPPFESVRPTLEQEMCFLSCVFTGHIFWRFRSESGCLRLQNQVFGMRSVAKTSFSQMLGFY